MDRGGARRLTGRASRAPGLWKATPTPEEAQLNQRFLRDELPNAQRVLRSDGTIAPTALGDAQAVRRLLRREGLRLEGGRAPQDARVRLDPEPGV